MGDRLALERDLAHILARCLAALADGVGDFIGLAETDTDLALLVTDDDAGKTLASASSLKETKNNLEVAKSLGQAAAAAAKAAGIATVVVDRGGFKYTGRVAAIVESAVEAGLSISAKKEEAK